MPHDGHCRTLLPKTITVVKYKIYHEFDKYKKVTKMSCRQMYTYERLYILRSLPPDNSILPEVRGSSVFTFCIFLSVYLFLCHIFMTTIAVHSS